MNPNGHVESEERFQVVVNEEEQYSLWPATREIPAGWRAEGTSGSRESCLSQIELLWTDMRPLSLRRALEQAALESVAHESVETVNGHAAEEPLDPLVRHLAEGRHPVVVGPSAARLAAAVARGFVHLTFSGTQGGTELGLRLDPAACDLATADFEAGRGALHLEGDLTLNFVPVRCVADLELESLQGSGHLQIRQ